MVNRTERTVWNPALSIPEKEFEFTDGQVDRIKPRLRTGTPTARPRTAAGLNH
jgi:hypothetical protein